MLNCSLLYITDRYLKVAIFANASSDRDAIALERKSLKMHNVMCEMIKSKFVSNRISRLWAFYLDKELRIYYLYACIWLVWCPEDVLEPLRLWLVRLKTIITDNKTENKNNQTTKLCFTFFIIHYYNHRHHYYYYQYY